MKCQQCEIYESLLEMIWKYAKAMFPEEVDRIMARIAQA